MSQRDSNERPAEKQSLDEIDVFSMKLSTPKANKPQFMSIPNEERLDTEVSLSSWTLQPSKKEKSIKKVKEKQGEKGTNIKSQKTMGRAKDELEYATNWRRAFTRIFTHLKWLNSYAKINFIAAET